MPLVHEALHLAIAAQLAKIREENGYRTEAGRNVLRVGLDVDRVSKGRLPLLVLEESINGTEIFQPFDQYVYQEKIAFVIGGMVYAGAIDLKKPDRAVAINHLLNDVIVSLLEDPTFGKACKDSVLKRRYTLVDADRPFAYLTVEFSCTIEYQRSDLL